MKTKNLYKYIIHLFLICISIITLFPIAYTIAGSFKTNSEILAHPENFFPEAFRIDNYIEILNGDEFNVLNLFNNSVMYTTAVVIIQLSVSSINAGVLYFKYSRQTR